MISGCSQKAHDVKESPTSLPIEDINVDSTALDTDGWYRNIWIDSTPFAISNTSESDYLWHEIQNSNTIYESKIRISVTLKAEPEALYENSSLGITFANHDFVTRKANFLSLVFQDGYWKLMHFIDDDWVDGVDFPELTDPSQSFIITLHEDQKSIVITNNEGLNFSHTFENHIFHGGDNFIVALLAGPKGQLSISGLIIDTFDGSLPIRIESASEVVPGEIKQNEQWNCADLPAVYLGEYNPDELPPGFKTERDLLNWTTQLANAYSGKIIFDENEFDAEQLQVDITQNISEYFKEIEIAGKITNFLVVDEIPLAVCTSNGYWQEATLRDLGDLLGIKIGTLIQDLGSSGIRNPSFWKNEYHTSVACMDIPNLAYEAPFDWEWNNWQIQTAKRNELEIRLQAIISPGNMPDWLTSDYTNENLDHMTRLVVEYAKENEVQEIVVANECPAAMMDDIVRAFKLARELYPEAKLIYNDTRNHFTRYHFSDVGRTLEISENLLELGLIDYVGVQMHIEDEIFPIKAEVIRVLKEYPVPVVITEFDAQLNFLPEDQRDAKMEEITRIVFESCIESGVCIGITTWGENDRTSWDGYSLLRDEKNMRKSAYYAAMQTMYVHLPRE